MLFRSLSVFTCMAITAAGLHAHENAADLRVGDVVFLHMSGPLANAYVIHVGGPGVSRKSQGLEIQVGATIAHELGDGRVRIEHSLPISRKGVPPRLLTLTAVIDSTKITSEITPQGTPVYQSPDERNDGERPTRTQQDRTTRRLELSELTDVKLRLWTLVEETGN